MSNLKSMFSEPILCRNVFGVCACNYSCEDSTFDIKIKIQSGQAWDWVKVSYGCNQVWGPSVLRR